MLAKLNPKQRKMAIAAMVGGGLALVVLLRRGGSSGVSDAVANSADPTATGVPADYAGAAGGTFADNGASAGQLTSAVVGLDGTVGALADQVSSLDAAFNAALAPAADDTAPASGSAPGPAGQTGTVINVNVPSARTGATSKAAAPAVPKGSQKLSNNKVVKTSVINRVKARWQATGKTASGAPVPKSHPAAAPAHTPAHKPPAHPSPHKGGKKK